MSGSTVFEEELIDMVEMTSPTKKPSYPKPKKRNKIHSPPFVSPVRSLDKDVVSLFSVKKSSRMSSFEEDSETISELSDEVFSEQSVRNVSKSEDLVESSRSNKSRLISHKTKKLKMSLEKIRRESREMDANIKSVRSRLSLDEKPDKPDFSFFTSVKEDIEEKYDEEPSDNEGRTHFLPENLRFNIELAEKDCFFVPTSQSVPLQNKLLDEQPRALEGEGLYVNANLKVPRRNLNVLEQRLLSTEDKKWFNCEGNITVLPDPLIDRSVKPDIDIIEGHGIAYNSPQSHFDMEEVLVVTENILELSLSQLNFYHHPLFSLEHVLREKLRQKFYKYSISVENNTLQKLRNQLEALKHAKRLKTDYSKVDMAKEIKRLREDLFREGKMQRDGLRFILDIWKGIKKLRQEQGYSTTTTKLVIRRDKSKFAEEKETFETFFVDTINDILEEHRSVYKKKLKEYSKKVNAKEDEINNANSDSDGPELEKPVYDVDEKYIESELRKKFEESFKPPGEPNLTLLLNDDNEITTDVNNDQENARRKVVSSTKFTLKILCNGILVCKSKPVSLNDSFVLDVNEVFSIQLTDIPKCLRISISEHPKGLLKKKICNLNIDVPSANVLYDKSKLTELEFEKKEIVHYKHAGVGSGYDIKKMVEDSGAPLEIKIDETELNTSGILLYRIGWHTSSTVVRSDQPLAQANWHESHIPNVLDKWGAIDENQLEAWLEGRRPDPQDPKNCAFFDYLELKNAGGEQRWKHKDKDYFRLNPYAEKMIFCNVEVLNQNIRLQYLKLRDQNEIEFDGMVVPNRIREIPFALLKDFKKRKALEAIEDDDFVDDLETIRDTGSRHLKQIYTRIFQMCKGLNDNLSYESVVDEKYLIYFEEVVKTSLKNFLNWFRWQPKLSKPLPRITKMNHTTTRSQTHKTQITRNKILMKILSGKNIPKTKKYTKRVDGESARSERDVRPVLEISYDDFLTRTSVLVGSDPVWNELVEIPLKCHHIDYLYPNALNGSISINLFDSIESDEGVNGECDKKFWLGEIKVPLSALTAGLNLHGWFKVTVPPLLLGYETLEDQLLPRSPKLTNIQNISTSETYIELDLHISPSIPLLEPNMLNEFVYSDCMALPRDGTTSYIQPTKADLPCNDVPYIKDYITKWNDIFNSSFPSKKFNVLALDANGRTNCITRYIRPLEPPQLNTEEFDVTPEQCLRYVSLIPFTECNPFYQNLWLKTDQLLHFMIGSVIDHCIALTCFLLALQMEAHLLLGYGVPQGPTAYVLITEYSRESELPTYLILDVVYNKTYYLSDPFCPLQRVHCLINGENVWGNTQRTLNPALLRFDLTRRSDWWPLFNNVTPAPTNFINNKINFTLAGDCQHIELQLERKLKRKISKWRPMDRTTFNHRVSEAFKNALRFFEINAMYGRSNTETLIELNKANSQYIVNGIVLNAPFTNISTIVKKIKRLNLHVQSSEVTDFALSASIQSYPGQVLSVWIFFGSVVPKFSL